MTHTHRWSRMNYKDDAALRTLCPPHIGPWFVCRGCGMATTALLQEEGWRP
jgi:hypothetical protein